MWITIIIVIAIVLAGIISYIMINSRKAEMQKYYGAAYKMIKEICLANALKNQKPRENHEQKVIIYLKWKDREKQGYVFDPQQGVRIGRNPGKNEICIREKMISGQHCVIYLSEGMLAIQDLNSSNGTWIRRGFWKHRLQGAEYLLSGDKIIVGGLKLTVTIFTFDMAYI